MRYSFSIYSDFGQNRGARPTEYNITALTFAMCGRPTHYPCMYQFVAYDGLSYRRQNGNYTFY